MAQAKRTPQVVRRNFNVRRQFAALGMFLGLLLAVGASSVLAQGEPSEDGTSWVLTPQLIEEANRAPTVDMEPPQPDLQAARELPHGSLDRTESLDLLTSVFGAAVERPAGIFDEMPEAKFIGTHAAIMPAGSFAEDSSAAADDAVEATSGQPSLVESSVPLKVENEAGETAPVDLSLERQDGELQPANPVIETGIPAELGDGVKLLGGTVELNFPGAPPGRAPSMIEGNSAFYPSIAEDTDLVIVPMPTGLETLTQIRTAEAPRTVVESLSLPANATLEPTDQGGAEVTQDGSTLIDISPATAVDATGEAVPTKLSVSGNDLTITVSPALGTVYPILVDPNFRLDQYNWTWGGSGWHGWQAVDSAPGYHALPFAGSTPALTLTSGFPGGGATPNTGAQWLYTVPRYYSDQTGYGELPHSWIEYVSLNGMMFLEEGNRAYFPEIVAGILDPYHSGWISMGTYNGTQGEFAGWSGNFAYPNYGNTDGKIFSFGLITLINEAQAIYRNALTAQAVVELRDEDTPGYTELQGPSGWWNTGEPALGYAAADSGLGVASFKVELEGQGASAQTYNLPCDGTTAYPCPRVAKSTEPAAPAIKLNAQTAPEGIDRYNVSVRDPLYGYESGGSDPTPHTSTGTVRMKVDHTPPTLALSGSLTEQASLGTAKPQYTLKYSAADGTENAPTYFAASPEGLYGHPTDIVSNSESFWVADKGSNRIVKVGLAGEILGTYSAVGTEQLKGPDGIDSDANGNVWVADTGNNRLVEFNSKGEWVRKVGKPGSGNSEFSAPQGIAVAPNGNVWVADTGNNRIEEFSSTGAFVGVFGSNGAGNGQFNEPTALAVAPNGNVWVADTGNNRIEELNGKGESLAAYGSLGSGSGQLNHPVGIQVDTRGSVWVADQNNSRVEQFSERGEYLSQFGAKGTGAGQFTFAGASGITTNSAGELWVIDSGNSRLQAWNPPVGTRSGVRKLVVKVDGKEIEHPEVNCPQGGCPLSGEWQLHSGEYTAGAHTVEVTATDGVNLSKTEKLNITLNPPNPSLAVAGTVTEQGTLGYTRPGYTLKVNASALEGTGSAQGAPSFVSSFGSSGTGNGQFKHPAGIAVDSAGNLWVADMENNRIEEFNSSGAFVKSVGSAGSGAGQFNQPKAIAIDPKGNFWVADAGNNRLEQFNPSWEFIKSVGSAGTGNGQFSSPQGLAIGANGNIWVADTYNYRVQELNENGEFIKVVSELGAIEPTAIALPPGGGGVWITDWAHNRVVQLTKGGFFIGSFGSSGAGNGQFANPDAVAIDNNGNVWIGDQNNRRIQEFTGSGEYVAQFGSAGSGAGQFNFGSPMGIAADAKGNIWVADTGNNRVERWRQPARSQVTTEITVDGKAIDASEAKCTTESCPITRNLRLESPVGTHTLVVKATDGYGRWASNTRTFKVEADTKKPELQIAGELANAPEGWVQQETYGLHATASDPGGYGVTSLLFRIDGSTVASAGSSCPEGACEATIEKGISMAPYSGGAHEAEVVATDGAGNKSTSAWTINVDPEGHISSTEAQATLEAVEATSDANLIGSSQVEELGGTAPGLGVEEVGGELVATGTEVPMAIDHEPAGGFTAEVPEAGEFAFCGANYEEWVEGEDPEAVHEISGEPCEESDELEGDAAGMVPIEVTPVDPAEQSGAPNLVEENATVAANTAPASDTVIRPLDDGGLVFQAIRDETAPESYSYRVSLGEDQVLRSIDSQHAEVYYSGHEPAFSITAVPAHDAVGTTVPTTLTVEGRDIVTLHINYKAGQAGQPFIYPIMAGTGWEGGFRTITVEMHNPLGEPEESGGSEEEGGIKGTGATTRVSLSAVSAPAASASSAQFPPHQYKISECEYPPYEIGGNEFKVPPYPIVPTDPRANLLAAVLGGCKDPGSNAELIAAVGIWGKFHYQNGQGVWVNESEHAHCVIWEGSRFRPGLKSCGVQPKSSQTAITVRADWRWPKSPIHPVEVECDTMYGHLNASKPHREEPKSIWHGVWPEDQPCPWPAWPN